MKTYYLNLICILLSLNLHAQVPGYMGKKFSIQYEPSVFPAFYKGEGDFTMGFNWRNDFNMDYVVSKSIALGVSVKNKTSLMKNAFFTREGYIDGVYYDEGFGGNIKLNTTSAGIYYKNFHFRKRGCIAPVGRYAKIELLMAWTKYETKKFNPFLVPQYIEPENYIYKIEEFNFEKHKPDFGIILTNGAQKIYNDKWIFDINGQVGFIIPQDLEMQIFNGDIHGTSDNDFQKAITARLTGAFFLNFSAGIGFIGF